MLTVVIPARSEGLNLLLCERCRPLTSENGPLIGRGTTWQFEGGFPGNVEGSDEEMLNNCDPVLFSEMKEHKITWKD